MKLDFVFVVLVYRNTKDLSSFFKTNPVRDKKVIVVNSFFDETTDEIFKRIAQEKNADYITVPNKGYGAGNNVGIEYALRNYTFKYLIISNADIEVKRLYIEDIQNFKTQILAPKIVARGGRFQNPNSPFKPCRLEEKLQYLCYIKEFKMLNICFYALSRLKKIVFKFLYGNSKNRKIYCAHGCFIIIPYRVIVKMIPLFDSNVFLFNEEFHVAKKAEKLLIDTLYVPSVFIKHKEDGSVDLLNDNIYNLMRDSYIRYYETWFK